MYKRYAGHGDDSIVLLNDNLEVIGGDPSLGKRAKWYEIRLHTVQHTGTNFMMKVLNDAGWRYIQSYHWKRNRTPVPESRYVEDFVISTIRKPEDVYVTWVSRQRKEDFFEIWGLLNRAFENNPNLYIVPVDLPCRNLYLERLAKKLHCELKTDWEPVASGQRVEVEPIDLTEIYNLPVVKHFYGEQNESKRI